MDLIIIIYFACVGSNLANAITKESFANILIL